MHGILASVPVHQVTTLLAATQRGDRARESELWALVGPAFERMARVILHLWRHPSTLLPEDLVQSAFVKVQRTCRERRHLRRTDLRAFVYRAMHQVLIDELRKRCVDGAEYIRCKGPVELDPWLRVDLEERLRRLAECSPRGRRVVDLRLVDGMTFAAIGAVLGCSAYTAQRDYERAIVTLREMGGA